MLVDYNGIEVDYSISFDDFLNKWWEDKFFSCYDYTSRGFLYNGCKVGFKTFDDCLKYRKFISTKNLNFRNFNKNFYSGYYPHVCCGG